MPTDVLACAHCGSSLPVGAPWCSLCLAPVAGSEPLATPGGAAEDGPGHAPQRPPPGVLVPTPRRSLRRPIALVLAALVLVGGGTGYALREFRGDKVDGRKSRVAEAFATGDGGGFGGAFLGGSKAAALDATPAERELALHYVAQIDPAVQGAHLAFVEMQAALDGWARGRVSDGAMARHAKDFGEQMRTVEETLMRASPPEFLRGDAGNLSQGATGYFVASDMLLRVIDGTTGFDKLLFNISVGNANVAWDRGLDALYGAAGQPVPARPNSD